MNYLTPDDVAASVANHHEMSTGFHPEVLAAIRGLAAVADSVQEHRRALIRKLIGWTPDCGVQLSVLLDEALALEQGFARWFAWYPVLRNGRPVWLKVLSRRWTPASDKELSLDDIPTRRKGHWTYR